MPKQPFTLENLALADILPEEAIRVIRNAGDTTSPEFAAKVYEALCALVWKLLAARSYGSEMREWYDVMRQTASLLSMTDRCRTYSERLRALADLCVASARFGSNQNLNELMDK